MVDHLLHFLACHENPLHAHGHRRVRHDVEHIPFTEKIFRAHRIENRTRIDGTYRAEPDTRGNIRLDDAGDHIHGGALRGDDEVNPRRARNLRDTRNHHFRIAPELPHHEIRKFIDHDHNPRHLFGFIFLLVIKFLQVPRTLFRKSREAAAHFRNHPPERLERLFRFRNDGRKEMRDAVVKRKFHALRIDENEFELVRRVLVEERNEERVHTHRFPRARGTCNEEVRHIGKIVNNCLAGNVAPKRQGERRLRFTELRTFQNLPQMHCGALNIRHFDADEGFAGDRSFDTE